jgi:UDP-sulfoquinovose synthase
MKVLVLGADGYIGWSLSMHLAKRGHVVSGIDNFERRKNVQDIGSTSAIPVLDMEERIRSFKHIHGKEISFYSGNLLDYDFLKEVVRETRPDSIVHLAEQPSAPFSMIDREHAIYTQHNNIEGTLNLLFAMKEYVPDCHLVKLGTMGEYGTPNVDIPEGFFEIEFRGRKDTLPFPRQPGSLYHLSKVHDSANVHFACRMWHLRSTDVMQGVVYGTRTAEMVDDSLMTRFDFDEWFGTVINRYCAEAVIGHPLTPYGSGGQKRGFIDLIDSVQCLTIAVENPPNRGEYRVFNQLDEIYSVTELANYVAQVGKTFRLDVRIQPISNPRIEKEDHYYKVDRKHLPDLGFRPTRRITDTLEIMLGDLLKYRDRIMERSEVIIPRTTWAGGRGEQRRPEATLAKRTMPQHAQSATESYPHPPSSFAASSEA